MKMKNNDKNLAIALEKIARYSAKIVANRRCVYCLHQPKQPKGIKSFMK